MNWSRKYRINFVIPKQEYEYIIDTQDFDIAFKEAIEEFKKDKTLDDILLDTTYEYELIEE